MGELYCALRIRETESDRARRDQKCAQDKISKKWLYVRSWCKQKAISCWLEGSADSVPKMAEWLKKEIDKSGEIGLKEFAITKAPSEVMIESWIRPFAPPSVTQPGRPKKPSN